MTSTLHHSSASNFRFDINGLRALAVLVVVIFHFRSQWLTGGFIGVDVFFVISGYLMTQIIFKGLHQNHFSLWQFLKRRFLRIAPALMVVVAIMLALGFLLYEPLSYKIMGKHGLSSLLFFSNNTYKRELGYFDQEAITKAFLHTWSLSIEFQFYIIYPIILWICSRVMTPRALKWLLLILTAVLFAVNIFYSQAQPVKSYFLLQCRVWEMMAGGLAFLFPLTLPQNQGRLLEILGLLLIAGGCVFIDSSKLSWPSWAALIPVLGAWMCIVSHGTTPLLSNPFSQFLGTISYSVYLVHWPLLSFLNHLSTQLNFAAYAALALLLAWLLHVLVEKRRRFGWVFLACFAATVGAALLVRQDGAAARLQDKSYALNLQEFRFKEEGHLGMNQHSAAPIYFNSRPDDFDYILWGDSHARHFFSYIKKAGLKTASMALDGCVSSANYYLDRTPECRDQYERLIALIKAHPHKTVLMSMYWGDGFDAKQRRGGEGQFPLLPELTAMNDIIAAAGSRLVLIGRTPSSPYVPYQCLARQALPINRLTQAVSCPADVPLDPAQLSVNRLLQQFAADHDNVQYIDAAAALCKNGRCQVRQGKNVIYTDKDHFSRFGSDLVGSYIFKQLQKP